MEIVETIILVPLFALLRINLSLSLSLLFFLGQKFIVITDRSCRIIQTEGKLRTIRKNK